MNDNFNEGNSPNAMMMFLAGAVVGAGIALLLAPATGEDTRRKIGDRARRLGEETKNRVQHLGEETKNRVQHLGEEAKNRAQHLGDEAKHRVQQATDTLTELKEDARSAIQTGRETFTQGRKQRSEPQGYADSGSPSRPL